MTAAPWQILIILAMLNIDPVAVGGNAGSVLTQSTAFSGTVTPCAAKESFLFSQTRTFSAGTPLSPLRQA
jgi:hypothetical protein